MFMGVRSHHHLPSVRCYADAVEALAAYDRLPPRIKHSPKAVTGIYERRYGDIAFRLYQTDVVTWSPDNSVLIDNYGTTTTSDFAARFLPAGINLRFPVTRQNGEIGGDAGIGYVVGRDIDHGICGEWYLCHGELVRFVEDGNGNWVPDEGTCAPIDLPVLDRAKTRGLSKRLHLAEFENYLRMAPHMIEIEHTGFDLDDCVEALERRDWRRAVETLPLIKPGMGFGTWERVKKAALPIATFPNEYVTMGSIDKLKLAIWDNEGMIATERHVTISMQAYASGMARARAVAALGGHSPWGIS